MAMPTATDPTTVSTGCRPRRLVVSSKNSSAASPACFATRRAPPKPSSTASAIADVRRDAVRAVSAICSPARPTTVSDIVSLLFDWMLISIERRYGKGMVGGNLAGMPLRGSYGPVTADITRQERASRISVERVRLHSSRQSGRCPDCSCANLPETWTVSRPYNTQMTHAQSLATRSILKILLAISLCAGNALAKENPPARDIADGRSRRTAGLMIIGTGKSAKARKFAILPIHGRCDYEFQIHEYWIR